MLSQYQTIPGKPRSSKGRGPRAVANPGATLAALVVVALLGACGVVDDYERLGGAFGIRWDARITVECPGAEPRITREEFCADDPGSQEWVEERYDEVNATAPAGCHINVRADPGAPPEVCPLD